MKKKFALLLSAAMMASLLAACSTTSDNDALTSESTEVTSTAASDEVDTVTLDVGSVMVYNIGENKLHVFASGDALGDVAYIVEGTDALVGICG